MTHETNPPSAAYVVVPAVATKEMQQAAQEVACSDAVRWGHLNAGDVWRAMIAAAPTPQAVGAGDGEAVKRARVAYAFHAEHCDHDDCLHAALEAAGYFALREERDALSAQIRVMDDVADKLREERDALRGEVASLREDLKGAHKQRKAAESALAEKSVASKQVIGHISRSLFKDISEPDTEGIKTEYVFGRIFKNPQPDSIPVYADHS
jgi:hypothetical protein